MSKLALAPDTIMEDGVEIGELEALLADDEKENRETPDSDDDDLRVLSALLQNDPSKQRSPKDNRCKHQLPTVNDSGPITGKKQGNGIKPSTTNTIGSVTDGSRLFDMGCENGNTDKEGSNLFFTRDSVNERKKYVDSDDSDWEQLDDGEKTELCEAGKEVHQLLKASAPVSCRSADEGTQLRKMPGKSWSIAAPHSSPEPKTVGVIQPSSTRPTHKPSQPISAKQDAITDPYSGIKIINPLVSSTTMAERMHSRKMIKLSQLPSRVNSGDLAGDWVTIGVIVNKSDTRRSTNGNTYSIWRLSDLESQRTVSFFLFNQTYKQHWKKSVGSVIGLLNANIMKNAENNPKYKDDTSLTIDHPDQLLVIGQSKDLGWCSGTTKAGNKCTNFLNKRMGEFCLYHVQAAYKKSCAKRPDVQTGFSGVTPKSYMKKLIPAGSCVFYQGQTFTSQASQPKRNKVTLKKLQQHRVPGSKFTTLDLYNLDLNDKDKSERTANVKKPFLDMLQTPTVGSINLVKHLSKSQLPSFINKVRSNNAPSVQSITAKELMNQHKRAMASKKRSRDGTPDVNTVPVIGRGLVPGSDINLDFSPVRSVKVSDKDRFSKEIAKKLAIAKIKAKGGISQDAKKSIVSPEVQERIEKRVNEDINGRCSSESSGSDHRTCEPPRKKSRYLGSLDLQSEEVQKLLKVKSSHTGAIEDLESERKERYFDGLEKREMYEEKMKSITEIKCTVYGCRQCGYESAFGASDMCKREGHVITSRTAYKKFFECRKCKRRTVSIYKLPTAPCTECGEHSYTRTCLMKERNGPKLESETLCLRGEELKYLNSLK